MNRKLVHIGTSGWYYEHWNKVFYKEIPTKERLTFYAKHFSTVELNTTFYHLPKTNTVKNWNLATPTGFIFAVKVSRYITHIKKLHNSKENVSLFFKAIAPLKEKLGPILFQLPYSFTRDDIRLEECIIQLPKKHTYVFEFRHPTWFTNEVYDLLRKYHIAFCITDFYGTLSPLEVTGNFVYIRLHGPKRRYRGSYSIQSLQELAKKIDEWNSQKITVFIFFNNDEKGYAIQDAKNLNEIIINM